MLIALASAQEGSIPPTPSIHRLQLGLPGYLILFAPLAFAPQRQNQSREPPSPPVFLPISTHFTATLGIPLSSLASSMAVSNAIPRLSRGISRLTYLAAYAPFTPNNSEQRLPPPYYRGCWHGVSRGFLWWYSQAGRLLTLLHFFPLDRTLRSEDLHRPRGVAGSGFRPLSKIPHCCLP